MGDYGVIYTEEELHMYDWRVEDGLGYYDENGTYHEYERDPNEPL